MTDDRKRPQTSREDDPDAKGRAPETKTKLPDKRAKLGDTIEGEGSPGITIGGGGHA
jgi:hypothetical protein